MEPRENEEFQLDNAYEEINFYECSERSNSNKPVISCVKGPKEFNGLFSKQDEKRNIEKESLMQNSSHLQSQNNGIFFNTQPLFLQEVDHNIQQIGLMAVKQVRYVTEQQWQEMMKQQQKYMREMKKINDQCKYESRQKQANKRKRNKKGQFMSKEEREQQKEKVQKQKKIRKSKEEEIGQKNDRKYKRLRNAERECKRKRGKQTIYQSDDNELQNL